MDKETFMDGVSWIDRLDFKLSTGTSGNSGLGPYAYWTLADNSEPYGGEPTLSISDPGNPELTWETQQKTTIGIDARIWKKFGVNLEFYHRLTTNMMMEVPYPLTTGFSFNYKNVGSYLNRGIDLRLDYDLWSDTHGNMASIYGILNYNTDKVIELFQGLQTWPMPNSYLLYKVGEPVTFFMPIFKQINPDSGDPEWYLPNEGDLSSTQMDDTKISVGNEFNEKALMQNTGIPRNTPYSGGFGFYGKYAGISLQADFSYYIGKHIISKDLLYSENPKRYPNNNFSRNGLDYWKQPGDHVHLPDIKRYTTLTQTDTRILQNASFCRLKNLTVGYELSHSLLERQDFLTGAKVSLIGRNLLTFTRFKGPDPEPGGHIAYGRNPASKQLMIGLELRF